MTIEGKVIFITGAATGIGHALAGRFRVDGALVVGTDLPARVDEIGDVADLALAADVTDAAQVHAAVDAAVSKLGRVDGLIANVGLGNGPRSKTRRGTTSRLSWTSTCSASCAACARCCP